MRNLPMTKKRIISRDCDSCLREPLVSCDWRRIDEDIMRLFGKALMFPLVA